MLSRWNKGWKKYRIVEGGELARTLGEGSARILQDDAPPSRILPDQPKTIISIITFDLSAKIFQCLLTIVWFLSSERLPVAWTSADEYRKHEQPTRNLQGDALGRINHGSRVTTVFAQKSTWIYRKFHHYEGWGSRLAEFPPTAAFRRKMNFYNSTKRNSVVIIVIFIIIIIITTSAVVAELNERH
jgi:hypothetical protein